MKREEVDTKKGRLEDINGHDNLLVTFGGIKQGMGVPLFEFFNSIKNLKCDKIFIRDFNQAWYQKGIDKEINHINLISIYLQNIIKKNKYSNVCFIGNSMGGYAAILFGVSLNINKVIAFAPQTFINKFNRIVYFDRRWSKEINTIFKFKHKNSDFFDLKKYLKRTDYHTKIKIFYSVNHRLDRIHSERLKNEKNIILLPKSEGGHSVVKAIKDTGELDKLLNEIF